MAIVILFDFIFRCIFLIRFLCVLLTGTTYLSVAIMFAFTAYYVHRSTVDNDSSLRRHQSRANSIRRLFISVTIFLVCNCLETPSTYMMTSTLFISFRAAKTDNVICLTDNESTQLTIAYVLAFTWSNMIFARIPLDPLLGIVLDAKMRRMLMR